MFPEAKLGIGPAIENGFYYDFDLPRTLIPEDLPLIEQKMHEIINSDVPFERSDLSVDEALERLSNSDEPYKCELVEELKKEGESEVSLYKTGDFVDLCRGPHVTSTADLKNVAFKLDKIAGAYWRGNEKNAMLQRIYALAFESSEDLDAFLKQREEALKRDHRKIAQEMDLFSFHEEGSNFVFWHDKGWSIFQKLLEYWRSIHRREGYSEINTPILMNKEVWERSGHLKNYGDKIYLAKTPENDDFDYALKPMNCIGGIIIYKTKMHSYRDLPLRVGEIGLVHRYESSGEVHGLMRLRQFNQDDAHIYCTNDQVKDEIMGVFKLAFEVYKKFGLEIDHIELSTRPEKSIGSDEVWERAEATMREILLENNIDHQINEGDGAFYGPKFDFHLRDAIGRTWQCGTIQLDFAQPENFDLTYIDENGEKQKPVMIHRVIFGAIERFLGVYIENVAGEFPAWIAPVQIEIIPVSDKFNEIAKKAKDKICDLITDARIEIDHRNESVSRKIRDAEIAKVPYSIVVGEREKGLEHFSVRFNREKNKTQVVSPDELKDLLEN